MPKAVIAIRTICRIAFAPAFSCPAAMQDNARNLKNEDELSERSGEGTVMLRRLPGNMLAVQRRQRDRWSEPRRYSSVDLRSGSRAVEAEIEADIENGVLVQTEIHPEVEGVDRSRARIGSNR